MADRTAKDRLFDALASAARALGVGRRAEIVDVLTQGERSVDELAGEIGQSVANTSHHLQVLAAAGLVTSRRDGTRVIYRIASPAVEQAWHVLRRLAAEQLAEFDAIAERYLGQRDALPVVSRRDAPRRVKNGAVLVDVRPAAEYHAGHIAGAHHVAPERLTELLADLPAGPVIAYCRGEYCVFADQAVRHLQAAGREAARLEDGFPEWRSAGLPVAAGAAPGRFPATTARR